jgi:hypothetical protein
MAMVSAAKRELVKTARRARKNGFMGELRSQRVK